MRRLNDWSAPVVLAALVAVSASTAGAQEASTETEAQRTEPPIASAATETETERAASASTARTPEEELLASPVPDRESIQWAAGSGRGCHRYHGRRSCEGPRRVPELDDEARARAEAIGLTQPRIAHRATSGPPPEEWQAAVTGESRPDLLWPVRGGRLWRGYGMHRAIRRVRGGRIEHARRRRLHEGVDIGAAEGTPILAVNDGLVVYSDNGMSGYGNAVLILHPDGSVSMYAHCHLTYVVPGQPVQRGQVIAEVGDTGLAHGAHLHFEYRVAGRTRDPLRLFVGRPDPHGTPEPTEEPDEEDDAEPQGVEVATAETRATPRTP